MTATPVSMTRDEQVQGSIAKLVADGGTGPAKLPLLFDGIVDLAKNLGSPIVMVDSTGVIKVTIDVDKVDIDTDGQIVSLSPDDALTILRADHVINSDSGAHEETFTTMLTQVWEQSSAKIEDTDALQPVTITVLDAVAA